MTDRAMVTTAFTQSLGGQKADKLIRLAQDFLRSGQGKEAAVQELYDRLYADTCNNPITNEAVRFLLVVALELASDAS